MTANTKYFIGIDFGSKFTRAAVLVESSQSVKLYDLIEIPLENTFDNNSDRYKAGLLDIVNYLKAKKIILKSAVTNLDNRYIRAVPHVIEIRNRTPFNSITGSLLKFARKKAAEPKIEPDEKIVDQYLGSLSIDGKKTLDHMKKTGKNLRQDSISIVMKTKDYVDLINASHEVGVFIEDVVPSNLSVLYLTEKTSLSPKEFSMFIDFGSRIAKVCFFNQQRVLAVENFEVGGDDVTNMICEELGYTFQEAEDFKLSSEFAILMEGKNLDKKTSRLVHRIKNENYVLLQLISHYAFQFGLDLTHMRNIILAGGGSKLPKLQEMIVEFYRKPCEKVGEKTFKYFLNYRIKPEISCSIGLAYSSYLKRREKVRSRSIPSVITGYFANRLENLLFTD